MSEKRLPRIRLLLGPGTLHSRGADRMDFLRYRLSGHPRFTGEELLAAIPEIKAHAEVEVDPRNPHDLQEAHRLQDAIAVEQARPGWFQAPAWDRASQTRVRNALVALGRTVPASSHLQRCTSEAHSS